MVDYYPVLARAIANLSTDDQKARGEIYARARSVLIKHLRDRGHPDSAPETIAERAAFESAVGRLEAERGAGSAKASAKQLSRLLAALQPEASAGLGSSDQTSPSTEPAATPPSPVEANTADDGARHDHAADDLGQMPRFLGAMLFRTAYAVAAIAITGVVYIRGLVWVSHGIIGHPTLLAVTAAVLGLFIVPPLTLARNISA